MLFIRSKHSQIGAKNLFIENMSSLYDISSLTVNSALPVPSHRKERLRLPSVLLIGEGFVAFSSAFFIVFI